MNTFKEHWEKIYSNSVESKFNWAQNVPTTSLQFLDLIHLSIDANIIDVGGGDSFFVDHLIELGFKKITVLDISEKAIKRAQLRLGKKSSFINWIVSDINEFKPNEIYDFWHDRATFHFLKSKEEIDRYFNNANKSISKNGYLMMSTFSDTGPDQCSGLKVIKYNKNSLTDIFESGFDRVKCVSEDHLTPHGTIQNFIYCLFKNRIDKTLPIHNQDKMEHIDITYNNMSCDINNRKNCCS